MKNTFLSILLMTTLSFNLPAQKTAFGAPFSDNMVLQRNASAKFWGSGDSGTLVTITTSWDNQSYNTEVNSNGKWSLSVNTPEGSFKEYTLTLETKGFKKKTVLNNVLIGEVWLASGQSNMVRPLRSSEGGEGAYTSRKDPYFRMFKIRDRHPKETDHDPPSSFNVHIEPQSDLHMATDGWVKGEEYGLEFNAVAWYFGTKLRKQLGMPVGIIGSAVGSTPVEAWLDKETASQFQWLKLDAKIGNDGIQPQHVPSVCFNGMINPIVGYTIKGIIWYQGESSSSVEELEQNKAMYHALIQSWRRLWGIGDFSFNMVQICPKSNRREPNKVPIFSNMLREIIYSTENTGMAITIDKLPTSGNNPGVIDCNQVHPHEKKYVGDRLAYWVLNKEYGFDDIVPSGPIATKAEIIDNTIEVSFDYVETGIVEKSGTGFKHFQIAGEDKVFYPANVELNSDNTLMLSNISVPEPKFVRYGYVECVDLAEQPVTFFNGAGLPASAFELEGRL